MQILSCIVLGASFLSVRASDAANLGPDAPYRRQAPGIVIVESGETLDEAMAKDPAKYFKQLMLQCTGKSNCFRNGLTHADKEDYLVHSLTVLRDLKSKKHPAYQECYSFALGFSLKLNPTFNAAYSWWNLQQSKHPSYIDQLHADDTEAFAKYAKEKSDAVQKSVKENGTLNSVNALKKVNQFSSLKLTGDEGSVATAKK
jgi:ribosomal protein L31